MSEITPPQAVHSELGASSYNRWRECPGSVALCRDVPKTTSVYAEEGTKAHDLAACILMGIATPPIHEEMEEAIQVYLYHIGTLRKERPDFEAVEQKLNLSSYHPKLFGTADYVCYFAQEKVLHVVDYKHGAGVAVEVEENEQLMYYGLGALHANQFPINKIVLTIVQPRCYHERGPIRSWETTPMEMLDFVATLIDDANATERLNAPLKTGDHCRWCAAQAICPQRHKESVLVAQGVFGNEVAYEPAKLSETLKKLDQIEAWCKSVRSFAYNEAEAGRIPPGFKLVDKRATRKWVDSIDAGKIKALSPNINSENMFDPMKLKSPAQIEKLLSKAEKPLLEELVTKESSGKNLVEDSDNRPKIAPKIVDVFDVIKN